MTGARTVRWWAFGLLVALAAPIGWLVFVADGWTVNRLVVAVWSRAAALGVQASPEQTDGVLNFLMLLPATLLASLWLPRVRWWVWVAAGAATAFGRIAAMLAPLLVPWIVAGAGRSTLFLLFGVMFGMAMVAAWFLPEYTDRALDET